MSMINIAEMMNFENFRVIEVTPELAAEWKKANTLNRNVSKSRVDRYADDMKSGKWKFAGDPIRFSKSGRLIDGQHRLDAIIESDMTVPMLVVFDLDEDTFDCIDTGKGRSGGDVLVIEGYQPRISNILSTSAKYAISYEAGWQPSKSTYPNYEVRRFVASNPPLVNSANYLASQPRTSPITHSAGAFLHFEVSRFDRSMADDFIRKLFTGADMGHDDIILALRNKLLNARLQGNGYSVLNSLYMCVKVWNSIRRGKPIRHINNAVRRGDETTFPVII